MSDNGKKRFGFLKIGAIVLVLLIAIIIALPFIINVNQFKPELQSKLSSALGREVAVGNLKLALLSGSVAVEDISIADNPSFSRSPFLAAKSLQVAVELKPLIFSKSIRISGITLEHPAITLIQSSSGKWNFSDLGSGKAVAQPSETNQPSGFSNKDLSIKELRILGGQVTIVHQGQRQKPSVYNDVNVTASNLSFAAAFPFSIDALLPGQGTLKLKGKAGPLNNRDMLMTPLSADLAVKHFDLIASGFMEPASGISGIIDFSGAVTSDGKQIQSNGQASAEKLQMVKGGSPAGRPISLKYAMNYDLLNQTGILSDASIGYGKAIAHLNGSFVARGSDLILKMGLRGTNMPVQDLEALLPALGIILPKGASLQGGFLNTNLTTEGPIERMVTAGTADLSNTRLVGFDLSGKMAAIATLAGLQSSQVTEIEKFASGLQLGSEGIKVSNMQLNVPAIGELSGDGRIAADQSLDFTMRAMLKPKGALGMGLARLTKGNALDVPFFVRGTASDPKFVPDVKKEAGSLLGSVLGQGTKEGQTNTGKALGDTLRGLLGKKK
jgi:AsmA protein